ATAPQHLPKTLCAARLSSPELSWVNRVLSARGLLPTCLGERHMALTTFNLAAIPVKFVAVPVLAGLAAGTGAVAAYVTAPTPAPKEQAAVVAALPAPSITPAVTEQAAPAKPNKKKSCEEQTWPYIQNR